MRADRVRRQPGFSLTPPPARLLNTFPSVPGSASTPGVFVRWVARFAVEAFHTGCIPFYKHFQTAVKSCSQGGVRGGAATLFYPMWHLEVESLLVLKNNRGVEGNRVRHMDYGVQINKLMYTRLLKGEDITLFSPSDVPGLYDAFFADQEEV